jgi:hypothetical protein
MESAFVDDFVVFLAPILPIPPCIFAQTLAHRRSDREPNHAATPCFCAGLAPPGKRIDYGRPGNFLWTRLRAFLDRHPLPRATILQIRRREHLLPEEPDAGIPHVRACEGWGWRHSHLLGNAASMIGPRLAAYSIEPVEPGIINPV